MDLTQILAVSGAPGLYKFVAQGKAGIIVESLSDGRRTMVNGSTKVSALGDIAIFTDSKEVPLSDLFQSMYDTKPSPVNIDNKSTPDQLHKFMEEVLPDYDRERVHNSDIKKIALWYNTLLKAGFTKFKIEEETEEAETEETETAKKTAHKIEAAEAPKKAAPKKAAATKVAAPRKVATSGPKMTASKSTTNRKSGS